MHAGIYRRRNKRIEFSKSVRKKNREIIIIFISHNNLSIVSIMKKFICPAGYFLLDEVNEATNFLFDVLKAEENMTSEQEPSMEVICQYERITIPISNVIYFMACNKKINCKLTDGEVIEFYGTLAQIEEFYGGFLLRSHAGYLINKSKILMINYTKNVINVSNNETIPISRKYRPVVKAYSDSDIYRNIKR